MDVEPGLLDFFGDLAYCVTSTPSDLAQRAANVGVLRIRRIGGEGDRDVDRPRISVQAYAVADYQNPRASHDLSALVEARFVELATYGTADSAPTPQPVGFLIEAPAWIGPVELPYADPAISVTETTYQFTTRR